MRLPHSPARCGSAAYHEISMSNPGAERFAQRREKFAKVVRQRKLDGFLVSDPVNVSYLTGFRGEASPLLVAPAKSLLISDARFDEQIEEECPGLDAAIRRPGKTPIAFLAETLRQAKLTKIGCEAGFL